MIKETVGNNTTSNPKSYSKQLKRIFTVYVVINKFSNCTNEKPDMHSRSSFDNINLLKYI